MNIVIDYSNVNSVLAHLDKIGSDLEISSHLKKGRSALKYEEWKHVEKEFSYVADFFVDSEDRFLKKLAKRLSLTSQREEFKKAIIASHTKNGVFDLEGLELSNEGKTHFCIFSKDAYNAGKVRYSEFTSCGFTTHYARDSYEEVLSEAIKDGFNTQVTGILNSLSSNPRFFECLRKLA